MRWPYPTRGLRYSSPSPPSLVARTQPLCSLRVGALSFASILSTASWLSSTTSTALRTPFTQESSSFFGLAAWRVGTVRPSR
eukprot:4728615-Pleurochrysis_carterae.AAC.1